MGEVFKEQLVKKEPSKEDSYKRVGIIFVAILLSVVVLFLLGPAGGLIFGLVFCYLGYRAIMNLDVEYEYIYTNGMLDIDVIYNKSKRKGIFTGTVKDFKVMAHISDEGRFEQYKDAKEKNYTSNLIKDNTYAFIINDKDKWIKIIIEPEQDILDAMAKELTSWKFHIKK